MTVLILADKFDIEALLWPLVCFDLKCSMTLVPFVACAISPNGSVIALRMDGKSDAQVLAAHTEGAGFRLPMTIVVVDRKNDSAKITIDTTGKITRR